MVADFVHDGFLDGRPFRCLTIVDHVANDSVAIVVGRTIGGHGVVDTLERLRLADRMPRTLQLDNGPEFRSFVLDQWCYENGVTLDFIQPGKPTQNAKIESFNGRLREECLNENWFLDLQDAQEKIAKPGGSTYNANRPQKSTRRTHTRRSAAGIHIERGNSHNCVDQMQGDGQDHGAGRRPQEGKGVSRGQPARRPHAIAPDQSEQSVCDPGEEQPESLEPLSRLEATGSSGSGRAKRRRSGTPP